MAVVVDRQADPETLDLLIREARQRQRRRRIGVLAAVALGAGIAAVVSAGGSAHRSVSLLSRPLHIPALGAAGRCPASAGSPVDTPDFTGIALGRGPVRVLIASGGDVARGRPQLGETQAPGWSALQTLWLARPGYGGPFVVRAAAVGGHRPVEVQAGGTGLIPGAGPLVVSAGPTSNTYSDGYRTVPGSTWVRRPGCYAWQVDGRGFSETIVFDALAARRS